MIPGFHCTASVLQLPTGIKYTVTIMRRLAFPFLALLAVFVIAIAGIGQVLSRPANRLLGPAVQDIPTQSVLPNSPMGVSASAWFVPGPRGLGAALLLHGVHSDRRQMLGRAKQA